MLPAAAAAERDRVGRDDGPTDPDPDAARRLLLPCWRGLAGVRCSEGGGGRREMRLRGVERREKPASSSSSSSVELEDFQEAEGGEGDAGASYLLYGSGDPTLADVPSDASPCLVRAAGVD